MPVPWAMRKYWEEKLRGGCCWRGGGDCQGSAHDGSFAGTVIFVEEFGLRELIGPSWIEDFEVFGTP